MRIDRKSRDGIIKYINIYLFTYRYTYVWTGMYVCFYYAVLVCLFFVCSGVKTDTKRRCPTRLNEEGKTPKTL